MPAIFRFSKTRQIDRFGIFKELLFPKNVNAARFARNFEWDYFCDFQTLWNNGKWNIIFSTRFSDFLSRFLIGNAVLIHGKLIRINTRRLFWWSKTCTSCPGYHDEKDKQKSLIVGALKITSENRSILAKWSRTNDNNQRLSCCEKNF